jgi:thiosulfate dehydrogenase
MKRTWVIVATLGANVWTASNQLPATETVAFDLTQWTPPDISKVGEDPFGELVKYGHALFTDTPNEIGPEVSDSAKRFAGNNLTCQNCHLQAGTQPYAMPMTGVWGQFPQYRGREGAVDMLEERINGCMERSMNGRALPLESREMKAFSSYMRWLSMVFPTARSSAAPARCRSRSPIAPLIPPAARKSMHKLARHVTVQTARDSARRAGSAISFRRFGVPTATITAPE